MFKRCDIVTKQHKLCLLLTKILYSMYEWICYENNYIVYNILINNNITVLLFTDDSD